jgi:hypothetical protein
VRAPGSPRPFFLNGFGYGSWVPRIAETQAKLGASEGQLGLALFMAAVGALLAMPLAGAAGAPLRQPGRDQRDRAVVRAEPALPRARPGPDRLGLALFVLGAAAGALDVSMNA